MAVVLSYCIPFVGYLFFAEVEAEDYVFRYLDQNAPEALAGWLAFLVFSIRYTAYFTWFISQNVVEAIARTAWATHRIPVLTMGTAVVFMSIAFSMMDDTWSLTLYGIGGFAFNILAFVLPAVYYLAQFHFTSVK
jgi:hypothetical protein